MSSQLTASQLTASQLTGSQRSYDSYSSSKISINNPKLLETVEDAIRRLILPELDAIKRERSQRDNSRRPKDRDSFSSLASASKEEISVTSKRKSADTSHSTKSKTSRGREARNDLSPQSSADDISVDENGRDAKTPKQNDRGKDTLTAAAIGAVAALQSPSRGDNKRERRRRRAEPSKRDSYTDEYGDVQHEVMPPMPLSSELNPSEMTRASIQSADSHRPHSASDEMTSVQEVNRGVPSVEAAKDVPAPAVTASQTLQPLSGLQAKISKGDLRNLPRRGTMEPDDFEEEEFRNERSRDQDNYYDDYDDEGRLGEAGTYDDEEDRLQQAYYGHQDVPAPLRYVPYQQERRGLSPIQSVSGFTEGGDSEVAGHRDSRIAPTDSELSASPEKPRGVWSPTSVPSNMRSREFNDEASSVLSSGVGYRQSTYTEDSELDGPVGRAVHAVGSNPQMIHHDSGPESAVASLVDGSHFDPSLLSGTGGQTHDHRNSQYSYDDGFTRDRSAQGSPLKQSVEAEHAARQQSVSPVSTAGDEPSTVSQNFVEYDLDEYGRKVPQAQYRHSPTASEAAITSAALRQATAEALKRKNVAQGSSELQDEEFVGEGVSRNKSFKERARGNFELAATPKHSTDRLSDYDQPNLGATGLPDMGNPMPEIGYGYEDGQHSRQQTPSIVEGMPGGQYAEDDREGAWTPTQEASYNQYDRSQTPKASESGFFGATDAAAAATIATATALAAAHHKRQDSQDQDDEWQRTSGDRKRDTLVTNPYEGASPIANLPGLDGLQGGYGANAYPDFNTGSPGLPAGDEGYISSAPNDLRSNNNNNVRGKGVDFAEQNRAGPSEDPFYSTPKGQRQMSGRSQGVGSPLYDASTGNGIEAIQSKDIIALMEHLMVRDAQRSARDTEMLVTLVQSAAEMRNSFEDIKRMLADTEDQIITEIKDNTEQTVKRHLGGPRPFPGSSPRSIQEDSQAGTMDEVAKKKRSFLRRALQGLGSKGANDLGRIEDMLMQLLTDVDVLKHQTAGPSDASPGAQSMRSIEGQEHDDQYDEQGYEPEGRAGTSTASYASQSGALSTGKNSGRLGHDRKISDNRISTVPEGNEDEYDDTYVTAANQYSPQQRGYFSPAPQLTRGGSVPLNTPPPQSSQQVPNSFSNENTPRTDDGKKHKSRGSATFFPKISRWSETTTSSFGKVFRTKKNPGEPPEDFLQHPASRSGSVDEYDTQYQYDSYGQDKLHSGFSEHDLSANVGASGVIEQPQSSFGGHGPPPASYATPEDPKYKAHRNSLNLMHPQPRPGQSFRTALESSAQVYDGPMSPNSADWAGSATSLNRFPEQNTNRYSDNSALTGQTGDSYHWQQSPAPPRPPKEPLEGSPLAQMHSPHQSSRLSHMQRTSPMPYASAVDSGYGTGSATHAGSYHSGSPKPENKNLSTALGVPTRRPSGPRAMTPTRSLDDGESERRRKRDTFGSVARPSSAASQETDTF